MADACVILFAKPPRPGRVKTRLVGGIVTPERAASLYAAFLHDMTARFASAADYDVRIAWGLDDPVESMPKSSLPGFRQEGRDLGERMFRALQRMARNYSYVLVVGTDRPDLPVSSVAQAFRWLRDGAEAVLGPSDDGGYYLIGLSAGSVRQELFSGIEWSTARVLEQTLSRFAEHGVVPELLPLGADVDRPDDLPALRRRLEASRSQAPATLAELESWGIEPIP